MTATSLQNQNPPGIYGSPEFVLTQSTAAELAAMSQTYRRAAAVGPGGGDAVLVTGVTTAGTVTLTLVNGGTATVSVPLGSSVLPFSASAAALGTAVGGTFQNLFFT